ncbi:hypothetical protein MKP05_09595 [Halomonas sp. EGI 63088]|uniref:C2H2-type domain-containing protein n=1 Tax=Halomonas flagellata TaxID=2920385 RepID=A0ABS9RU80_9GAMM|nr:hypothetical protein [Halomonas flagellata]MCH4563382.1 hypothetical protein [Halomonas flagellata]
MNNAQVHGCPLEGWVCFHCGELFTTVGAAADHFGTTPDRQPACLIKLGDERGLVMALRKAEDERDALASVLAKAQAMADSQLVDHSDHVDEDGGPCLAARTGSKTWHAQWARDLHVILAEASTISLTRHDAEIQAKALSLASTLFMTMDRHSARQEITRRIAKLQQTRGEGQPS